VTRIPITRALISVYDKTGLEDLASGLYAAGVEIVSTGSTAARIAAAGVPVTPVGQLTGFPECLDGRVKTLHPKVHAGLLADTANPAHEAQLAELGIEPFQLVVVNLYPFEATVASGASAEQCVEQIDIGGPAMVRAAAKNHGSVAVVIKPSRYADVLAALAEGGFTRDQRRSLAGAAFAHTAAYDLAVASWFASGYAPDETAQDSGWPAVAGALWRRADVLRYGENPHQRAALYKDLSAEQGGAGRPGAGTGIAAAELLHGKAMSYNNYVDADAARRAAYDFAEPCVAIIKHSNPCGIAVGADLAEAHAKANACDPASAFGGVIAANGPVTAGLARQIAEVFTEVVIAPGFDAEALDILSAAKNVRLLRCRPGGTTPRNPPLLGGSSPQTPLGGTQPAGAPAPSGPPGPSGIPGSGSLGPPAGLLSAMEWRPVSGGILLQSVDRVDQPGDDPANWQLKAGPAATPEQLADLAFAWKACRSVKSNAILLASGGASVGVGMGQVNRVDSSRLAVMRAGDRAAGSVAASDAYFPFADGFEILAQAGVAAVVEPGGSIRDHLTIAAAEAAGIPLYFTGVRHFYH
jgi:phosphoribosylaminoimidazolecarboxamide formyltransferase / IMP cyclohydrolase